MIMAELDESYLELRLMALNAVDGDLSQPSADHAHVSGIVVDVPTKDGFVTLVALTDDTTSLYTSTGGGTIGAGKNESVAQVGHQLLRVAELHLTAFANIDVGDFPATDQVRFHLLTPEGGQFVDVPEPSFWGREPHPLVPLVAAAQDVITKVRAPS